MACLPGPEVAGLVVVELEAVIAATAMTEKERLVVVALVAEERAAVVPAVVEREVPVAVTVVREAMPLGWSAAELAAAAMAAVAMVAVALAVVAREEVEEGWECLAAVATAAVVQAARQGVAVACTVHPPVRAEGQGVKEKEVEVMWVAVAVAEVVGEAVVDQ